MSEYIVQSETLTDIVSSVKKYEAGFVDNIDSLLPLRPEFIRSDDSTAYTGDQITIWIISYEKRYDNEGNYRLVLLKESYEEGEQPETPQYDALEPLYYDGSEYIDGVLYDRWRKIEEGGDVHYTWDADEKMYYYTTPLTKPWSLEKTTAEIEVIAKIPDVDVATPNITVSTTGLISAGVEQHAGIVKDDRTTAEFQLNTDVGGGYTPKTTSKTWAAKTYLLNDLTVYGSDALVPENIKQGITLFNVNGTYKKPLRKTVYEQSLSNTSTISPVSSTDPTVRAYNIILDILNPAAIKELRIVEYISGLSSYNSLFEGTANSNITIVRGDNIVVVIVDNNLVKIIDDAQGFDQGSEVERVVVKLLKQDSIVSNVARLTYSVIE